MAGELSVFGHAMVTSVGNDGVSTCAAMRAKVSGVGRANLWDRTIAKSLQAARPQLQQWWEGATMLPVLAAWPLGACLQQAATGATGRAVDPQRICVVTLLPPVSRPQRAPDLEQTFQRGLQEHMNRAFSAGSTVLSAGRTGAVHALAWIRRAFESNQADAAVVVGVESFLRQAVVNHYLDAERLLCGISSNGFIPGEAACAVLVARTQESRGPCLQIVGEALEREAAPGSDKVTYANRGEALTRAWRRALKQATVPLYDIAFTLSDLNGERSKFKESTFAMARLDRVPPEGRSRRAKGFMDVWQPSEYLGEIGAAVSPCMLGWAFEAGLRGYAPSAHALLYSSEDDGERMAMVTRFLPHGTTA